MQLPIPKAPISWRRFGFEGKLASTKKKLGFPERESDLQFRPDASVWTRNRSSETANLLNNLGFESEM